MARRALIALSVAACLALAGISTLSAKQAQSTPGPTVSDKGTKTRGSADNDSNVKTKEGPNDSAKTTPAPPNKGGDKTRGTYGILHFDNHTPWILQLFVDGDFVGVVGRWGDVEAPCAGVTALYARAVFTDGSVTTWGPRTINCNGYYTWRLDQ